MPHVSLHSLQQLIHDTSHLIKILQQVQNPARNLFLPKPRAGSIASYSGESGRGRRYSRGDEGGADSAAECRSLHPCASLGDASRGSEEGRSEHCDGGVGVREASSGVCEGNVQLELWVLATSNECLRVCACSVPEAEGMSSDLEPCLVDTRQLPLRVPYLRLADHTHYFSIAGKLPREREVPLKLELEHVESSRCSGASPSTPTALSYTHGPSCRHSAA